MTTPATTLTAAPHTSSISRSRIGLIALWTLQIAVAGMFLMAGSMKISAAPEMVATFELIGLGQWFRYLTGAIELVAALALLIPSLAAFGALLLVPTMIGAVATHLFIVGGSATPAIVLLVASSGIVWARRRELGGALAKVR
jgi:putative oxidoreductase